MARDRTVIVPANSGRRVRGAGGAETWVKVTGTETAGLLEVFEQVAQPGSGPPFHIHRECSEALYIVQGHVEVRFEGHVVDAPVGAFVFVPSGVGHTYVNVGRTDAKVLFWFAPAARMSDYFAELAEVSSASIDGDTVARIAIKHGVEIVREPPHP
jgi:mannose-6-phosphate isomerase-like protein (cupin superfamily)